MHGLPKEKGLVIKFGANFENILDKESTIDKFKAKRLDNKILTLLFVGVDWERKGGHIAERVTRILNEMGIDTKLEVVGIPSIKNSDFINSHGFLKIENPEQQLLLSNLFFKSHFFILPTKAECYGIVFCESSSFGLPIISYNTGGVSSAITNNENGFLFEPGTDAMELAIKIKELYFNRTQYIELCNNTYEQYQKNLNWDCAIKSFIKII